MAEEGALLLLSDELVQIGERYYVKASARFVHENESVEITAYARESEVKKGMDESQITGTASSYARKYALNGLFLIDDTKDADTDEYAKTTKKATHEADKAALRNGISFPAVRDRLATIDSVEALESYWRSLELSPGQQNILKADFSARKAAIEGGAED